MSRRLLFAVSASLALATAGARAASITLWEHADFRGASTSFDRAVPRLGAAGWNDRVSSLRVESGRWEICRDDGFLGCRTISADMAGLGSLDGGWNDAISSLRPVGEAGEDSAEGVARRLYQAILGREPDPEGLRNATTQVERNQTANLVRGMTQSAEYQSLRAERSAAELLDQIVRGLYRQPADAAARRVWVPRLERGEDAQVVLALLAAGAPDTAPDSPAPAPPPTDLDLQAQGAGLVVWANQGRYESLSGARVRLARGGQAQLELAGTTPQTFSGTWSREQDGVFRLAVPDIGGRRVDAVGRLELDAGRLARLDLVAGTLGARNQIVFSFVASGWSVPREELLCAEEARAELERERGAPQAMLFLAPERSTVASGRDRLTGGALVLAAPAAFTYRCEVDTRRGQVASASLERR